MSWLYRAERIFLLTRLKPGIVTLGTWTLELVLIVLGLSRQAALNTYQL
jgi:hypothetical protein